MIIAHYAHRLPADYDLGIIRDRAVARGPFWEDVPGLHFKGFLLRERGRYGAIANEYSSLYLWQTDEALRDALLSGRYKTVTDSFGRAAIETRLALDARRGAGRDAKFAYRQDLAIPLDADLNAAFAAEIERNREIAKRPGTVAATVGVDPLNWTFTRILLSENAPDGAEGEQAYQILYLVRSLFDKLAP
jgi:Domain of unknown function (DUF4865)